MSLTLRQLKQFSVNDTKKFNQLCRKLSQKNQWISRQMVSQVLSAGADSASTDKFVSIICNNLLLTTPDLKQCENENAHAWICRAAAIEKNTKFGTQLQKLAMSDPKALQSWYKSFTNLDSNSTELEQMMAEKYPFPESLRIPDSLKHVVSLSGSVNYVKGDSRICIGECEDKRGILSRMFSSCENKDCYQCRSTEPGETARILGKKFSSCHVRPFRFHINAKSVDRLYNAKSLMDQAKSLTNEIVELGTTLLSDKPWKAALDKFLSLLATYTPEIPHPITQKPMSHDLILAIITRPVNIESSVGDLETLARESGSQNAILGYLSIAISGLSFLYQYYTGKAVHYAVESFGAAVLCLFYQVSQVMLFSQLLSKLKRDQEGKVISGEEIKKFFIDCFVNTNNPYASVFTALNATKAIANGLAYIKDMSKKIVYRLPMKDLSVAIVPVKP